MYTEENLQVTYKTPRPKTCMTWNGNKIKTFDGVSFSQELFCSHTLVQDIDGIFSIILRACPYESTQPCPHALEIFTQSERFTFEKNVVDGKVKMFTTKKEIPIPVQMTGLRVTLSGLDVRILLEQIPITVTWNSEVNYFRALFCSGRFELICELFPITLRNLYKLMQPRVYGIEHLGYVARWMEL
jgi:hypothetical protein